MLLRFSHLFTPLGDLKDQQGRAHPLFSDRLDGIDSSSSLVPLALQFSCMF